MWELLLLPAVAVSGWWVAKHTRPGSSQGRDLPSHYFKGLNYLLNEQPDKAIEVFIRMTEVDSETIETHFALGKLFRRRGEVDRAIRIHQNLIARVTLSSSHRAQALLELGEDYTRAGLLDRAETLFLELIEREEHLVPALQHLIDIYQLENDWDKAIAASLRLQCATGVSSGKTIAHYYCELADQAKQNNDVGLTRGMIGRALEYDRDCVRASLMQGLIEIEAGNYPVAVEALKRIEQQNIDYISEAVAPLLLCYRALGLRQEMIEYLKNILCRHDSITIILALAELLREQYGDPCAANFITEQLRKRPSVRGLDRLIELNLAYLQGEARENLFILRDLVRKLLQEKPVYLCGKCGFKGKAMYWNCPGCKNWSSVKPIHGVEGE